MIEDKILLLKLRANDPQALKIIYVKYKDYLLSLATSMTKETAKAEDIVHDVFLKLAVSGHKIKLFGNFKSYLATCVVNQLRSDYRKQKIRTHTDIDTQPIESKNTKTPLNWIIQQEDNKQLVTALSALDYDQREVIVLKLIGKMKFKTIAQSQNIPINTAQSRYRNGLKKLRSLLKNTELKK